MSAPNVSLDGGVGGVGGGVGGVLSRVHRRPRVMNARLVSAPHETTRGGMGTTGQARVAAAACVCLLAFASGCNRSKPTPAADGSDGGASATAVAAASASGANSAAGEGARPSGSAGGLSAPIAATHLEGGDIVVAGIDVPARSIRIQKIASNDTVTMERTILEGIAWSSDAELKLAPAGAGVAVTWRGKRGGRTVRQLQFVGNDLVPKGEAVDVAVGSCATRDALWFTDGKKVEARTWAGAAVRASLPKEEEAELVCGAHRAFALLDRDDGTSLWFMNAPSLPPADAGTAGAPARTDVSAPLVGPIGLLKESEFGDDEQRERAEYTVGDELGVVRLGASGAVAFREVKEKGPGPLHKLKTSIGRDDDVVAVDASARAVVVVFAVDASAGCTVDGGPASRAKVMALRIDRETLEESTFELSAGECGREVGPFFTGVHDDGVSVSWVERVPVVGKASAPIAGLAHRFVAPSGPLSSTLGRIDQAADAVVDAGCDASRCYAVSLVRKPGMDGMVPGMARVLPHP